MWLLFPESQRALQMISTAYSSWCVQVRKCCFLLMIMKCTEAKRGCAFGANGSSCICLMIKSEKVSGAVNSPPPSSPFQISCIPHWKKWLFTVRWGAIKHSTHQEGHLEFLKSLSWNLHILSPKAKQRSIKIPFLPICLSSIIVSVSLSNSNKRYGSHAYGLV